MGQRGLLGEADDPLARDLEHAEVNARRAGRRGDGQRGARAHVDVEQLAEVEIGEDVTVHDEEVLG